MKAGKVQTFRSLDAHKQTTRVVSSLKLENERFGCLICLVKEKSFEITSLLSFKASSWGDYFESSQFITVKEVVNKVEQPAFRRH